MAMAGVGNPSLMYVSMAGAKTSILAGKVAKIGPYPGALYNLVPGCQSSYHLSCLLGSAGRLAGAVCVQCS